MLQVLPEKVTVAAKELKKHFVTYPDFPKKGINFWFVILENFYLYVYEM